MNDEQIHECKGTETNWTVIRYSSTEDGWLMMVSHGEDHDVINFCPYCGVKLD